MKTGEKFHVEKENYDRLWQSFTERLQRGKKNQNKNVTQAYPASTKQGKEQNHSLLDTKRGKKESSTTVTTSVCACSI